MLGVIGRRNGIVPRLTSGSMDPLRQFALFEFYLLGGRIVVIRKSHNGSRGCSRLEGHWRNAASDVRVSLWARITRFPGPCECRDTPWGGPNGRSRKMISGRTVRLFVFTAVLMCCWSQEVRAQVPYENWVIADDFNIGCAQCTCDLNRNGTCDTGDLAFLANCFNNPTPTQCRNADLNCDGDVDNIDLSYLQCLFSGQPTDVCCPNPQPRPEVNKIRWYGSYLDPAFDPLFTPNNREPDAWLIALHSDLPAAACPAGGPAGAVPIDLCGTLVQGVESGCVMFQPDSSSFLYNILNPNTFMPPHVIGDRVRLCGYLNNNIPTTCQQGIGNIFVNAVLDCDTKVSRPDRLIAQWGFRNVDVVRTLTGKHGWDGHPIYCYEVKVPRGCLQHNFAGPDEVPAPNGPFYPRPGRTYWLSIQASVGYDIAKIGPGQCVDIATGNTVVQDFWGWHTTPPGHQHLDDAYLGEVYMGCPPDEWLYEWIHHLHCGDPQFLGCCDDPTKSIDMAFYLLQEKRGVCVGTNLACETDSDCPVPGGCIVSGKDATWWCQPVNGGPPPIDVPPLPRPFPKGNVDELPNTEAMIVAQIGPSQQTLQLTGPVVIGRNGLDQLMPPFPSVVETEMLALELTGLGGERLRLNPDPPFGGTSSGQATAGPGGRGNPWPADSFFDVFVEVDLPGLPTLASMGPVRVQTQIFEMPPTGSSASGGVSFEGPANGPVQLVIKATGQPIGVINLVRHTIRPRGGVNVHSDLDWGNLPNADCCEPDPTSPTLCTPTVCPNPTEICRPTGIIWQPGQIPMATDCACQEDTKCHLEFNAVGPTCVNDCPDPTLDCQLIGTGTAADPFRCDCRPVQVCEPNTTGTGCNPVTCPFPGLECTPQAVKCIPGTTICSVVNCGCGDPNTCHVDLNAAGQPYCVSPCPNGTDTCTLGGTDTDGDGVWDLFYCHCQPPPDCDVNSQGTECNPVTCPTPTDKCQARCVVVDPLTGEVRLSDCDCLDGNECHMNLAPPQGAGTPPTDCVVGDNGLGTAMFPPSGCLYRESPTKIPLEVARVASPSGHLYATGIHCTFECANPPTPLCPIGINPPLSCDDGTGGPIDGERECSSGECSMHLEGDGSLAGYVRDVSIPISTESIAGPRQPGAAVQSFDTEMVQMFGQLPPGDPDFDLLRVVGGSRYRLPSPGHTTLTRLPNGNWAVDSFFDVFVEVELKVKPTPPPPLLGGMHGSTTGTIRMSTKPFQCSNDCPPGMQCVETSTQQADGTIKVCCDCVPVPVCEPTPDHLACNPNSCPIGVECRPKRIQCFPPPIGCQVVECDCNDNNQCHPEMPPAGATEPICTGSCPIPPQHNKCVRRKAPIPGQNGFEYTCRCVPVHKVPLGDPTLPNKNRTISMSFDTSPLAVGPGLNPQAIRIRPMELQNPIPANPLCCPAPDFGAYEVGTCSAAGEMNGCARWVGPPQTFFESASNPLLGSYRGARLQCTPYFTDWSTEGLVHVIGAEILSSSQYEAQFIDVNCSDTFDEECYSAALPIRTARWGDVAPSFNPPSSTPQPDAIDVASLVNKFRNVSGAPSKVLAQLQPNVPDPNTDINALDIVSCVDAFRGLAYPYPGPCQCPPAVTCNATACTSPAQCPGGSCVKVCNGGTNAGLPCNNGSNCPAGLCGAGFCRDRCGRCSP